MKAFFSFILLIPMKKLFVFLFTSTVIFIIYKGLKRINLNPNFEIGQKIDSLNNVIVFYNGGVDNVEQRNTKDGYNLGLEYQCVEFVKRYYYEHLNHKMPDSYGHAKSFYLNSIKDGKLNTQRNLTQFTNPSSYSPKQSDLIIMEGSLFNRYGHVAIISKVNENSIEIIQQNPGPFSGSREQFELLNDKNDKWLINNNRVLGWLRK